MERKKIGDNDDTNEKSAGVFQSPINKRDPQVSDIARLSLLLIGDLSPSSWREMTSKILGLFPPMILLTGKKKNHGTKNQPIHNSSEVIGLFTIIRHHHQNPMAGKIIIDLSLRQPAFFFFLSIFAPAKEPSQKKKMSTTSAPTTVRPPRNISTTITIQTAFPLLFTAHTTHHLHHHHQPLLLLFSPFFSHFLFRLSCSSIFLACDCYRRLQPLHIEPERGLGAV